MTLTRAECAALDAADPLGPFRDEFALPEGVRYLDGNSLGALPRRAAERVARAVRAEWGDGLVRSWNDAGWFGLPRRLGDRIAPLIGARPGEVVVADSTSVNLFKVLTAALRLRPGRRVLVGDLDNFPTDLYVGAGAAGLFPGAGRRFVSARGPSLAEVLDQDVAVVALSQVDYRTGRLHDMAAVTAQVHAAGAMVVWDLCHSAGALPVELSACEADFAVGCTYKYLNGGPGSPAFLYAAPRHHQAAESPLTGWFGHADPFAFEPGFRPDAGIGRFQVGTPPILSLAALEASLEVWERVDLALVRAKSLSLTDLFIELTAPLGLELVTPREHAMRGSQVSLRHPHGYRVMRALIERGVIGDFRAPDVMRFGFTPLYLSFTDVWDAAAVLGEVLAGQTWRDERHGVRDTVT